jgi:hypothetical protein
MGLRALNPTPIGGVIAEVRANLCPSTRKPRVDGAQLGWLGIGACKYFGILVEARGEGCRAERGYRRNPTPAGQKRPDLGTPVIAVIGKKPNPTAEGGCATRPCRPYAKRRLIAEMHAKVGCSGIEPCKCFGILVGGEGEGYLKSPGSPGSPSSRDIAGIGRAKPYCGGATSHDIAEVGK